MRNDIDKLIATQQEYVYFSNHCKDLPDKNAYTRLKQDPVLQSSYMKQVFAACDRRLIAQQHLARTQKVSRWIFQGMLLFFILLLFSLLLLF